LSFKWGFVLWMAGLLLPGACLLYWRFARRRTRSARAFTSPAMSPNVVTELPRWRVHLPAILYVLAVAALLIAVARPVASREVPREQATVMLVMDNSRSMLARDVDPSRLAAARAAAVALLDQLPHTFRVGVVGFHKHARVLSRPTIDRVAIRSALSSMTTSPGTAIGSGVIRGLDLFADERRERRPPAVILLLSDGNNTTGPAPRLAAARARRTGIRVHTIALGSTKAMGLRGPRPANFRALSEIARETRGRFFSAPTEERLQAVYRGLASSVSFETERTEVSSLFVGAALGLLVIGGALSSVWFHRVP
jgi:Ca-activated chloride channel family protein